MPMPSPDSSQIHASDQKGTLCPTRPATLLGNLSQRIQYVLRHPLLETHCPDKQGITAQMLHRGCMAAFGRWSKREATTLSGTCWPVDCVPR